MPRIAAVVLAAGRSSRMGRDKLALPWRGGTVLDAVITAARALSPVVLAAGPVMADGTAMPGRPHVTGFPGERDALEGPCLHGGPGAPESHAPNRPGWPDNPDMPDDASVPGVRCEPGRPGLILVVPDTAAPAQSGSLKAAIAALPPGLDGAMVLLGDMPLVTPGLVERLAGAFRPGRFLVPAHAGRRGNPVIIPAEWFPRVMELQGDTGARPLFALPDASVDVVEVDDPAVVTDIDTPEDYSRLTNQPLRADP